jgi:hypothetical protein
MYQCKKCDFNTNTVSAIANHYQFSHRKENQECVCNRCGKHFKNQKGFKCHNEKACIKQITKNAIKHTCPLCNSHISNHISEHIKTCGGKGVRRFREKTGRGHNWALGKTYAELYGAEKAGALKEKISKKLKGRPNHTSEKAAAEKSRKLSEIAKKNNYGGYKIGSGRGKHGWYKGYWCDSSWELAFVIYNLEHNISFIRNIKKFEYRCNNENHYWIPDFIMSNVYYEIKGYLTAKDKCKFANFNQPFKVLREKDVKYMIDYAISKYGKNYIKLYEK